jgi:hypothetical protein
MVYYKRTFRETARSQTAPGWGEKCRTAGRVAGHTLAS